MIYIRGVKLLVLVTNMWPANDVFFAQSINIV